MATQYYSLPVPVATDYVKDGWDAIADLGNAVDAAVAIPSYNNQTGTSYTFALTDAAKVVSSNNGSAVTFTVPPQGSVTWTAGATLTVVNYGAGSVTIAGGVGVTVTNTGATIAQYGSATIIRTASDAWTVVPFAGGAAALTDGAISGTTGSPTSATYTSGGINYKTYKFTGSGSITLSKAGLIDVLVVGSGGGGGSNNGGGGGGGSVITQTIYATAATHTITIGAGGSGNSTPLACMGNPSAIGLSTNTYLSAAIAGGGGGSDATGNVKDGANGSSGGGGCGGTYAGTGGSPLLSGIGFAGGTKATGGNGGCGGGGAGAVGIGGINNDGGAGGAGTSNTFATGSSITYGGGGGGKGTTWGAGGAGGGGSNSAGTANTGGGGGGNYAGGSGVLIVRVKA